MDQSSEINWKTVLKTGGAFIAFQIGAGFASGQEAMQYFGTHGGIYPFVLPIIAGILVAIYCFICFKTGYTYHFQNPNEAYDYYCGSVLGKIINLFTNITIGLTTLLMFAGCGATVHQYLGTPVWVGAVGIGILSAGVVCLGLEKITNVLGSCGVLIIGIMAAVGIYTFFTADQSIMESQKNILKYVEEGLFLQINAFGTNNPFLTTLSFVGMGLSLVMTFNVSLGSGFHNRKEYAAGSVCCAILFVLGIYMCLFTMLLNLDYIADKAAMVPMLAAIENAMPFITLPYTIVVCIGIFTTIVGYLWVIGRRFGGQDGSLRQRLVVILLTVIGITVGSLIPLDKLVNIIFPIAGYVGIVLFICMLAAYARMKQKAPEAQKMNQSACP